MPPFGRSRLSVSIPIPQDVHFACCEVLCRVTIQIRAFPDIERKVVHALMEATHNIPLYLQSGNPDLGSQKQWDIDNFDSRFGSERYALCLRDIYDEALARFADR
jgi:hypothetical protein